MPFSDKRATINRRATVTPNLWTFFTASSGHYLTEADLLGFTFDGDSLQRLVTNNRNSLSTLILPAGVNGGDVLARLGPLPSLWELSVAATDLPGLKGVLSKSLCLNIRGEIPRSTTRVYK